VYLPILVCINKYDLNDENSRQVESYCFDQGVEVVSKIPFDNAVTQALVQGLPVVEYSQGKVAQEIDALWRTVTGTLSR
jgi:MinD superfamily P-loop ATPase